MVQSGGRGPLPKKFPQLQYPHLKFQYDRIFFLIVDFLVHFWFIPKNWQKHPHFQYLSPYQHININIPHSTYHIATYQHTTYHISHTHIPHTTIYFIPYYLYCLGGFFFAPIFLFANIPLSCPKTIPLLKFKSILWNWSLQINGILVNTTFGNVSTS